MKVEETLRVGYTSQRAWELEYDRFPDRTEQEWTRAIRKDGPGVQQKLDRPNQVMEVPMEIISAYFIGEQLPWQNLRWYRQALGSGSASVGSEQTDLAYEVFRKSFTEHTRIDRINYALTIFGAADFQVTATTISAVTSTTVFTVNAIGNIVPGTMVRVALTAGYEFHTVDSVNGNEITLTNALSALPLVGATVHQAIEEAALFGNLPASYGTGIVEVTNGSPTVTGTGTEWIDKLGPGDKIKFADELDWYEVLTVDSDTQITLTTNYDGVTGSGKIYIFRGTMFNRVTGVRYVKPVARGFAFETQWVMGSL